MVVRNFILAKTLIIAATSEAALIAHYEFDGSGADSGTSGGTAIIAADGASLLTGNVAWDGNDVNDIVSAVGSGSLLSTQPTVDTSGGDGAVSGNSFGAWTVDTRSVAFWMRAVGTQDANPTMISLGSGTGGGNRFDIRMTALGVLRFEVQSGGSDSSITVGDGNWHHVTVVVPSDGATVSDVLYYVHGTNGALEASGNFSNTRALNTLAGPLRMGDSYQDTGRDFSGYLDDVRLYDNALTQSEAQGLAALWSPQMVAVPEPSSCLLLSLGGLGLLRRRR